MSHDLFSSRPFQNTATFLPMDISKCKDILKNGGPFKAWKLILRLNTNPSLFFNSARSPQNTSHSKRKGRRLKREWNKPTTVQPTTVSKTNHSKSSIYKHSNEQQTHRLCLRPNCKEQHSESERERERERWETINSTGTKVVNRTCKSAITNTKWIQVEDVAAIKQNESLASTTT